MCLSVSIYVCVSVCLCVCVCGCLTIFRYCLYFGFDYTSIDINTRTRGIKFIWASKEWPQAVAGARTYDTNSPAVPSPPWYPFGHPGILMKKDCSVNQWYAWWLETTRSPTKCLTEYAKPAKDIYIYIYICIICMFDLTIHPYICTQGTED